MSHSPESGLIIEHDAVGAGPVRVQPAPVVAVASPPAAGSIDTTSVVPRLMVRAVRAGNGIALRVQRLGAVSTAGLVLLFTALILFFSVLLPLHRQVAALEAELRRSTAKPEVHATATEATHSATAFVARLPARTDLPLVLATVLQQARAAGLSLDQGSYEMAGGKSRRVGRYSVTLPVQGSYPQLRQFIDATLLAVPAASVDSLRLQREKIGSAKVAAEIRFTVFVREVGPGATP